MTQFIAVKRVSIDVPFDADDEFDAARDDVADDEVGFIARHVVVIFIALLVLTFGAVLVIEGQQLRDRVSIALDLDRGAAR